MDVPDCRQRNDYDCGPACVRAALRAFDLIPLGVDTILKPHPVTGTSPERIVACFNAHGLTVRQWEEMGWTDLRHAVARAVVLVPMQLHGEGHWVVVKGATARTVSLMDPCPSMQNVTIMGRWPFMAAWRDEHPPGIHLDRFALEVSRGGRSQRLSWAA